MLQGKVLTHIHVQSSTASSRQPVPAPQLKYEVSWMMGETHNVRKFNTVRYSRDQDRDYTFSLTFATSTVLLTTPKIAAFGEKCKSSPLQKEKH